MPRGITILGLGPGAPGQLTLEAWQVLESAEEIVLRTAQHPIVPHLPKGLEVRSLDYLYEVKPTFEAVYSGIVQEVLRLAHRPQGVLYGVPGHPWMAEATVLPIRQQAEKAHLPVRMVTGLSFLEPTLTALRVDGLEGFQLLDGVDMAQRLTPGVNPDQPILIGQLYNPAVGSQVKLALMAEFPDDHPVCLVRAAGTSSERVWQVPLYQLDRQKDIDHLTSCYVPPLSKTGSLTSLREVVARLRAPDGCPWDREQTHNSLRSSLLEETYEVLEALDSGDPEQLKEELGDMLLQVVLHQQIAVEEGEFRPSEVIGHLVDKLVRRHPHVFGELEVEGSEEVLRNWEVIKRLEREDSSNERKSVLDGVVSALPALARAQALQERASRVGFDWRDIAGVVAKIEEEIAEFREAHMINQEACELGDLLFSLVNLARWLGLDAESLLRETNERFVHRFKGVEARAAEEGRVLTDCTPKELDSYWESEKGSKSDPSLPAGLSYRI
jgi:tetrapyrrole methylase family protein/MazG family protein